jgi:hypothetical protein
MRHQFGDRPGLVADTLSIVEGAGRSALDDLRRMLGVLHSDDEEA